MYRPPGSCTTQFLEDFLALSGFLSSTGSSFIICGDINVHLDIECGDRSRFNDILQCCGLVQSVSGPTHLLGHTLDVLISPCDSDFVRNVSVGDFISDHAAIRCQLDFSHPSTSIDKWVSYRRYHRIDIRCVTSIELESISLLKWQSLLQMPWLVVVWTIVTLCSEVCPVSISTNCKVFRTPLLALLQIIESMLMLHPFYRNSTGCLLSIVVFSKPQHLCINFCIVVLLLISNL